MRKNPTNLFTWATSELSQDAFICWLLAWAKPENKLRDELMHQVGEDFLKALLAKHGIEISDVRTLKIITQKFHIDVLAIINDEYAMIIEDKVHTGSHGSQLDDYVAALKKNEAYKNYIVLPTFVKTGSQSRYVKEEKAGYKLFLRKDFLSVLSDARNNQIRNNILIDFLENVEELHADVQSFLITEKWTDNAWIGFYEYLQNNISSVRWGYVANPLGGFYGAWWHLMDWKSCDVYLQIEQNLLCFKISVEGDVSKSQLRNECHKYILNSAKLIGLNNVERPGRFGNGACMTVAVIKQENWMIKTEHNLIDLDATLRVLEQAARCVDLAIKPKVII